MNAILTKSLKSGTKTIYGEVVQRGLGFITLIITSKTGNKKIKRYKISDYTIKTY